MKRVAVLVFSLAAVIGAEDRCFAHHDEEPDEDDKAAKPYRVVIEVVDADTGEGLPAVISVKDIALNRVAVEALEPRGRGVEEEFAIHDWQLLGRKMLKLPRQWLVIKAFSGLETETASYTIDPTREKRDNIRVTLKVKRFHSAKKAGWQNANTHVHLQKLSKPEADKYLTSVAIADGLDLVYVSYLERAELDLEYTTNKYTLEDLLKLSSGHTHFDNGQEHRHNFGPYEEGYGHVMLLHIPELVRPVSLGPGITGRGSDGVPLRPGIEKALGWDSTVIWCHNRWGLEDTPNWLAGKLHANNIFDGGTHGSYEHSFYRYLNAGLKVPFSTGTDWFIYDFNRVYVPAKERLTSEEWLKQLAAGRSYITNGPLLEFTVDGQSLGDTVELKGPGEVAVRGRAVGRVGFEKLELVQNGKVIQRVDANPVRGHYEAVLDEKVTIDSPCWLALRTPPPSADGFSELSKKTPLNEYGREIFSHTSAVFVRVAGRDVFQKDAAQSLLDEMQKDRDSISKRGRFQDDAEKERVLSVYEAGIAEMQRRLEAVEPR